MGKPQFTPMLNALSNGTYLIRLLRVRAFKEIQLVKHLHSVKVLNEWSHYKE
jgi:hypothetical protein